MALPSLCLYCGQEASRSLPVGKVAHAGWAYVRELYVWCHALLLHAFLPQSGDLDSTCGEHSSRLDCAAHGHGV